MLLPPRLLAALAEEPLPPLKALLPPPPFEG
jgi:hypothetical protein